ncbi:McrC family protein [Mycoplasma corogypsi]|uniref:McrC family protein n=1 Tax=Mycoplasma corogypsi TaxID=2106 RepID=UPI00387390FB
MIKNVFEEKTIKNSKLPEAWRSQPALDDLAEFLQLNWEQRAVFYEDGKIDTKQQFLTFLGQKALRTNNYIGTIVFKGEQLNIFPKMFRLDSTDDDVSELDLKHLMHNLIQWLDYCTKIDYPYMGITSDLNESADLRELFITLYIRYVKNALDRSLFYKYEEETEDRSVIKGKVDLRDFFSRKFPNGQLDKFRCIYSNFDFDNTLNRIIKFTCKSLLNVTSKQNQKHIRNILTKLNEVSDVRCTPRDCDRIRLSKLNKHYSIVLSMSKMFLLNKTSTYNVDKTESFCFLFPTEVLFEGFIGGFMQSILKGNAKVKIQASDKTVFSDVIYAGQSLGRTMRMKHDILVEHKEKGLFILDTKYKKVNRFDGNDDIRAVVNGEVNANDIYQVLTYARTRQVKDVYLLYPLFRYEDIEPHNPIAINKTTSGTDPINVHLVRLPFVFEDDIEETKNKLSKVILDIFD